MYLTRRSFTRGGRRPSRPRLRLVTTAALVAIGASFCAPAFASANARDGGRDAGASAPIVDPAAGQLAQDFGVPLAEAEARIDRQPAEDALAVQLAGQDTSYAGSYVDEADGGTLVIRFVGHDSPASATAIRTSSMASVSRIDPTATYSYDSLFGDEAKAQSDYASLEAGGGSTIPVELAVNVAFNVVDVSGPAIANLPTKWQAWVAGLPNEFGGAVTYLAGAKTT